MYYSPQDRNLPSKSRDQKLNEPLAKIRIYIDLKLSIYVLSSPHNKCRRFQILSCSNLGTGTFSIFDHVTCPENFKRVDYYSITKCKNLNKMY